MNYYKKILVDEKYQPYVEEDVSFNKTSNFWMKLSEIAFIYEKRGLLSIDDDVKLPLLTFSFLDWFQGFDFSSWQLIEFGGGNSTLWFSKKFKKVTTFETNKEWSNILKEKTDQIDNVSIFYIDEEELPTATWDFSLCSQKFAVLIDCAANRRILTENFLKKYLPNLIILDNSDIYINTKHFLIDAGWFEVSFWGLKSNESFESCTSIFIKSFDNTLLKRKKYNSPGSRKIYNIEDWDLTK